MKQSLKTFIKRIVPESVIDKMIIFIAKIKIICKTRKAKKLFLNAPETPQWLNRNILESLQQKYSPPTEYGYNSDVLEQRGAKRV